MCCARAEIAARRWSTAPSPAPTGSTTPGPSPAYSRRCCSTGSPRRRRVRRSGLDHQWNDHGAAAVALVHPATDHPPDHLLQLEGVGGATARGLGERVGDARLDPVEDGLVLREAA